MQGNGCIQGIIFYPFSVFIGGIAQHIPGLAVHIPQDSHPLQSGVSQQRGHRLALLLAYLIQQQPAGASIRG